MEFSYKMSFKHIFVYPLTKSPVVLVSTFSWTKIVKLKVFNDVYLPTCLVTDESMGFNNNSSLFHNAGLLITQYIVHGYDWD